MTHTQFLRIKKLRGKNIINHAAKHNHRELLAEIGGDGHIDPARSGDNYVLRGARTAADVAGTANDLLSEAALSRPLRKDAVRALEIIFSLPPDSAIDHRQYFEDSTQWAEKYYQVPVLSAVVHLDESAPHCHVLLLPLLDGHMVGARLMGNRASLQAMQGDFHGQVGRRYGLTRQTAPKRQSMAIRRQAALMALDTIETSPSRLNKPSVKHAMVDAISHDPEPLLMALDLNMPTPQRSKPASLVDIMIRPCKPEKKSKPIDFARKKPIGFDSPADLEKDQSLSCVDFADSLSPIPTPEPSAPPVIFTREHDSDYQSGYWDTDTGEFIHQQSASDRSWLFDNVISTSTT